MFFDNGKKDTQIVIRVSDLQKYVIVSLAEQKGLTVTDYIFSLIDSDLFTMDDEFIMSLVRQFEKKED